MTTAPSPHSDHASGPPSSASTFPLAPPLPRDAGRKLLPSGIIERRIVWNLIDKLSAAGFAVVSVYDGEEVVECKDAMTAMDLIFNLDESHLLVGKPDGQTHWILLVGGNSEDIVSDWGCPTDDSDGFDASMQAFIDAVTENF